LKKKYKNILYAKVLYLIKKVVESEDSDFYEIMGLPKSTLMMYMHGVRYIFKD